MREGAEKIQVTERSEFESGGKSTTGNAGRGSGGGW